MRLAGIKSVYINMIIKNGWMIKNPAVFIPAKLWRFGIMAGKFLYRYVQNENHVVLL
jgi:hypothetical protein